MTIPAPPLTVGQCASMACLLEVTASKPGNVHRGADFEGLTFDDFARSAVAIAPAMDQASSQGFGKTVLQAVTATQNLVPTNTNLGIILLLTPLAQVPESTGVKTGLPVVLRNLSNEDSTHCYEAIRLSKPGGMGSVKKMDVDDEAPHILLEAMRAAQDRDLIARQYANDFSDLFDFVIPALKRCRESQWGINDSIIHTHLQVMARFPDSLIARKAGVQVAQQSANMAGKV